MVQGTIHFDEQPTRLRISWNNRELRKDRFTFCFLLLCWIVWAPITCVATVKIFTSDSPIFFTIWCVFGWLGTVMIPLTLLQRFWSEWIEIGAESLSWGASGILARKPKEVPFARIGEFGLGWYSNRSKHERNAHESMVTLNVYESPGSLGTPRHLLGYWLTKEDKKLIFDRVKDYVAKRALPLKVTVYGKA